MSRQSWIILVAIGFIAFGTGLMELNKLFQGRGGTLTFVSIIFCGMAAICILVAAIHAIRNPPDA